jgi:hypothetical protein
MVLALGIERGLGQWSGQMVRQRLVPQLDKAEVLDSGRQIKAAMEVVEYSRHETELVKPDLQHLHPPPQLFRYCTFRPTRLNSVTLQRPILDRAQRLQSGERLHGSKRNSSCHSCCGSSRLFRNGRLFEHAQSAVEKERCES